MNKCNIPECTNEAKNKFCSLSYASKSNKNRFVPPKTNKCKACSKPIRSVRVYCKECYFSVYTAKRKSRATSELTLDQLISNENYNGQTRIREHARLVTKDREQKCYLCGYDKITNVCHIRAVKDFPRETKVCKVNEPSNLVILCPNHHAELDRGLLSSQDLNTITNHVRTQNPNH